MAQFDALGWLRFARHKAVKLTSYERLALCVLISHARAMDGWGQCWPSVRLMAREMTCSDRTVQRAIFGLERKGVIRVLVRKFETGQRPNLYQLPLDPPKIHADKLPHGEPVTVRHRVVTETKTTGVLRTGTG